MRYLLYLTSDEQDQEIHYLIDRKNDYWFMSPDQGLLHFPIPGDREGHHINTLIDGELVFDKLPNGQTQPKFLVFDCMVLDGNSLMSRTLDKRLAYFQERIFAPYTQLLKDFPGEIPYMHFLMEMKSMQVAYGVEMMFRQILPSLPHGNDGLIFTCRMTDYKHGTDPHILKWKPEAENSIDLRLSLDFPMIQPDEQDIAEGITEPYYDYDALPICNLHVYIGDSSNEDTWFSTLFLEPSEWESLKALQQPLEDRIVECYMDSQRRWRYMRFRDDKKEANHTSTVQSVIESITDRVTEKDLIAAAKGIRVEWKLREKKEAERKMVASTGVSSAAPLAVKRKADEQGNGRPSPGPPAKRE
jgi:mRNA guanylyltransferase